MLSPRAVRATALTTAACAALAITLTGCAGPSLKEGCAALVSGTSKSALTVSNLLTNGEIGFTKLEAAAKEVEGYMQPLRDIEISAEIAPLRDSLIADVDKLVVAIRVFNTEDISLIAQNMTKTAVDVDLACS